MQKGRIVKIFLTLIAIELVGVFAMSPHFSVPATGSVYFALTLIGVALICWRLTRSWLMAGCTVLAGGAVALLIAISGQPLTIVGGMSALGLGSLLVIGTRVIWAEGDERRLFAWGFAGSFSLLASEYFGLNLLTATQNANAKVLDLYLYSFDASLHFPVSFLLGQVWQRVGWIHIAGALVYAGLFLPVAVVFAGLLQRDRQRAIHALASVVVTAPVGVMFYRAFPALGPIYVFHQGFPWHPLTYTDASRLFVEPIALQGLRNAMPSLHLTWALLAFWWSRTLSLWDRLLTAFFVVFTIIATLGTGEHYLIDLIVACPFAIMVYSACSFSLTRDRRWLLVSFFGLLGTFVWFAALRYGLRVFWTSPAIPWIACVLTVGLGVFALKNPKRNATSSSAIDVPELVVEAK